MDGRSKKDDDERRDLPPILAKLLALDVEWTKRFVSFSLNFVPIRSLKTHCKFLEVSSLHCLSFQQTQLFMLIYFFTTCSLLFFITFIFFPLKWIHFIYFRCFSDKFSRWNVAVCWVFDIYLFVYCVFFTFVGIKFDSFVAYKAPFIHLNYNFPLFSSTLAMDWFGYRYCWRCVGWSTTQTTIKHKWIYFSASS